MATTLATTPTSTQVTARASVAVGAPDTITVIGKATVISAPDEAVLTLTVESEAAEPGVSMEANSQTTKKVMERLQAEGVADTAIETSSVSVYPVRTYDPKTGKENLTGYRTQNTLAVTLRDARVVGKVLAASLETGVTNVSGPVWRLTEDSAAVTEALSKAVANARAKAEALAGAQGVKVGEVIMMNEGSVEVPFTQVYAEYATDLKAAARGAVTEPPISAANLDVTATVTVTYVLVR